MKNTKTSLELQTNINSIMKSFQQFTNPSYEDIKLDLPKVQMNGKKSIIETRLCYWSQFYMEGTNKIISGIFEPYEKVTIVKPVGNPDAFYGDEDGEYEKVFQRTKIVVNFYIKSNSLAP